jgi:non-ribosomal peptide synthetase component E (peptide arylation enzyme)
VRNEKRTSQSMLKSAFTSPGNFHDARADVRPPFSTGGFQPATLIDLLTRRASQQPGRVAYTFLGTEEGEEGSVTYGELDRQARTVASRLQSMGISEGERVLLLYPAGLEYVAAFLGCLYAGVVAVPAYPPRPNRPLTGFEPSRRIRRRRRRSPPPTSCQTKSAGLCTPRRWSRCAGWPPTTAKA